PGSLLGKILRLAPGENGYSIPPGNPFAHLPSYRPEIWAVGLRNPWGASFDRVTGELFIPDVGNLDEEEINVQPATSRGGENYGWPWMEGNKELDIAAANRIDPAALAWPVFTYRGGAGPAIIGGACYRG